MMKKNINIMMLAAALICAAACTLAPLGSEDPVSDNGAVIVNSSDDAISGELLIKFRPELSDLLDRSCITKSASGERKLDRLGIRTVDDLMDIIGGYEFERVFPVDPRSEDVARKEGLHLWYIVRFDEDTDVEEAARSLSRLGELSKVEYSKEIKRMATTPAKAFAPQASASSTGFNDPGLPYQWGYVNTGSIPSSDVTNLVCGMDINCETAWKYCAGDPSIIVAVMDEGVMWSHPDLIANAWTNEGEIYKSAEDNDGNGYAGDVHGYNFVDNTGVITWNDLKDTGHGTHVAGTIAAVNNNGVGVCGIAGGTGNGDGVKIMSLQIFSGDRGVTYANEVRAIKYAADNGAVVLQCSWGYNSALADPLYYRRGYGSDEEYEKHAPLEKEAFDYFIYHAGTRNGVIDGGVVVFAAGNEYAAMAAYPGAYRDYISVSALAGDYTPSTYSNYGPGVDICAPGGDTDYHCSVKGGILSTLPSQVSDGQMYGYMEGTSMACPHISGFVALGLSYAAKQHKHYDSREFKDIVLKSVRDIDSHLTGQKLYHFMWGSVGDACPTLVDLRKTYYGNMGSGVADAALLMKNIDASGTPVILSNMYVATGSRAVQDVALCFDSASSYRAESSDSEVAEVSVSGSEVIVKGLRAGTARLTVTPDRGQAQTALITVRDDASNGGGWL